MHRSAGLLALSILSLLSLALRAAETAGSAPQPVSRAEASGFTETSRARDIDAFLAQLAEQTPLIRTSTFGRSEEGRPLVLVTASDPPINTPAEARALGRPIVLLQANIHGGEVEGKEATQHLLRRLTLGDLRPLLSQIVVLAIPNYNVDGNEAIDVMHRTEQYGPIAGVGRRENAKGLDLNRDYMKLDSLEGQAFVRLLTTWDPHVVVDLHTTNGSYHGYHLTYSIPVNLTLEPALLSFQRDTMMPHLQALLRERHQIRSYYYGNFPVRPRAEMDQPPKAWFAFDHRPRIGQNYVGLRHRIAILSEAYSYLHYKDRIRVTEAFVEEILRYVATQATAVMQLTATLDRTFVERARTTPELPLGVEYEATPLPTKIPILVGAVSREVNPRNGLEMKVARSDVATPVEMLDYGYFTPTRTVPMAQAYLIPESPHAAGIRTILERHGIMMEVLTDARSLDISEYRLESVNAETLAFQGRHGLQIRGRYETSTRDIPSGTTVVRLDQPLGRLAAYLLEPESDDGLVAWDLLSPRPIPDGIYPIQKVMRSPPLPLRPLSK